MASVYLVNALYKEKANAPTHPAMQPAAEAETPAIEAENPPAAVPQCVVESVQPAPETTPPAAESEQPTVHHKQQPDNGRAMHPSRQREVILKGPLDEEPEPIVYKASGANTLALGQKAPPISAKRGKGAMNQQRIVAPGSPGNLQAARERSFNAVIPSATAAARLGQSLFRGNQVNVGLDPRLRKKPVEGQEAAIASTGSTPFGACSIKQEEVAWESFSEQAAPRLPEAPTAVAPSPQPSGSLPFRPIIGYNQLPEPPMAVLSEVQALSVKQPESDPPSESEIRIQELENENISLRQASFAKDREIRKLKSERDRLRTTLAADADVRVGAKRPRYDETMGGPVQRY